jgi:endoglycosylceramidase
VLRGRAIACLFGSVATLVGCGGGDDSKSTTSGGEVDAGTCASPDFSGAPLGVHCKALVDAEGRTVLLHGVNARIKGIWDVALDGGRTPFLEVPAFTADDAKRIRAVGFNALRLPLQWSGVEPTEDGGLSDAYLDRVADVVAFCKAADLLILIDLHQDLYSKELGGDGAPLWAIVPPPAKAFSSPLDAADSDLASRETGKAFATFFGSSSDGARLRSRFAKMVTKVATRFRDEPQVFGIELFNEPLASDEQLLAFDSELVPAVREAAPDKLVLFEPNAVRNIIGKASIGSGSIGKGTVYAPHVYTLAFTGSEQAKNEVTKAILEPSNESARAEADGWESPLVITEFGFDTTTKSFANYIRWQYELEDQFLASSFYWVWKEYGTWGFFDIDANGKATERPKVFAAHERLRLEAVAGTLTKVGYDASTKHFEAEFIGDDSITAPNLVSIGMASDFSNPVATCDGKSVAAKGEPVAIRCSGAGAHTITLAPR